MQQLSPQIDRYIDERMQLVLDQTRGMIETEKDLLKMELFLGATVSPKQRRNIQQFVRKDRDSRWKEALKLAGGDELKAMELYDTLG
jgi:hypothetical protein